MRPAAPPSLVIAPVSGEAEIAAARALLVEYGASLDFSLDFQAFDAELARLPGKYAPPDGRLLLARLGGSVAGCVALHRWDATAAEMERLYVRPAARGARVGRALAEEAIVQARMLGYRRMLLHTVPTMRAALALYRDLGFRDIAPYRPIPIPGAVFLEREL